ncbi:PepSY-associated TM helix domain-containing protein [Deinococcus roseus]|uniref:Peptidase n=1 Tax=Deinococcus roseus TaxID=392414 RepID=A0ABQ2CXY4_9DEIO|nr:PepSY-associated TM helix domain-containing protein [Deinococcus roseus]GGJ31770.1 peptidase [Deinococcus roseus]
MTTEPRNNPINRAQNAPAVKKRPLKVRVYALMRSLHLYISMFSLLIILFFAGTGITLNHPEWVFGSDMVRKDFSGNLPADWKKDGKIDPLGVAEFLRETHHLKGKAQDFQEGDTESSLSFKAPGYSADAFVDMKHGTYTLAVDAQGAVAAMNDLHRGKNAGSVWAKAIDFSSIFLILISVTGIALMLYMKKVRLVALITIVVGSGAMLGLMSLAM